MWRRGRAPTRSRIRPLASHGLPGRLNAGAAKINAAVGTNYRCPIGDYLAYCASRGCTLALPSRNPADADVVLLGNSHAQMYAPLVAGVIAAHGLHGLLVPANGCLPWTATNIDVLCQAVAATNLAAVAALPRARLVIIAFNWSALSGDLVDRSGRAVAPGPIAAAWRRLMRRSLRCARPVRRSSLLGRSPCRDGMWRQS